MKYYILTLFCICFVCMCLAQDKPSVDQIMKDYNHTYRVYKGQLKEEPDAFTAVFDFDENSMVFFPDYRDEENTEEEFSGFDSSEVEWNYYEGHFTDKLREQCIVLITPRDYYPAGPTWGLPCSLLILYTKQENTWKFTYTTSFYDAATIISLDDKNQTNIFYIRIDYCNMGSCQWVETVYGFRDNKLQDLYFTVCSNENMRAEDLYMNDKKSFKETYHPGDTLGIVQSLNDFSDYNHDGLKDMIITESCSILMKPVKGQFTTKEYLRSWIYIYKNDEFVLLKTTKYHSEDEGEQ